MNQSVPKRPTSASGPAAGYYYQVRYSLYRGLQLHPKFPTGSISVETIDDVTVQSPGQQIDSQLKHSVDDTKLLTSSFPGIWRTFAIWLDQITNGMAEKHEFHFITTMTVAENDPLTKLRPEATTQDRDDALGDLRLIASQSSNAISAKDRAKFLKCSPITQAVLIKQTRVVDNFPNLGNLATEIDALLHWACDPHNSVAFREELEGWWLNRLWNSWIKNEGADIPLEELAQRVWFLRNKYRPDELPLDVPEEDCGEIMETRPFIKQIRLVTTSDRRIKNAQKAFLRSSIQRSKWVREYRIDPEELDKFDEELCGRWESQHAQISDELPDPCGEDSRVQAGRKVLGWAEASEVAIRNTRSTFLTSGSYHALADSLKVGWHPNYVSLVGSSK